MIQEGYKSQSLDSQIDLRYIFRTLKKNAVFILMCVCLTGMFSYVILDHSLKDTYTVSVNLCVIPRDNTSEKLAETNIENALERSVNVLNSDTMRDQIMKASGRKPECVSCCRYEYYQNECVGNECGECL